MLQKQWLQEAALSSESVGGSKNKIVLLNLRSLEEEPYRAETQTSEEWCWVPGDGISEGMQ